jgi:DNA polymerase III epsilon subunit family exonuclease
MELTTEVLAGTRPPRRKPRADRDVPSVRLASLSWVVVDVETTGGSPWYGDRVTEIAAVVVRDGRIAETYDTLVNPQRPIPIFVTRLTHITPAMVQDKPLFREVCPVVLDLLRDHVFVGHNAAFDRRFVKAEVERAGRELPDARMLCTVRLARRLLPHLRRRSLDHVAHHYGVTFGARHRAMGDAKATAQCLIRMLDDIGTLGLDTWTDLRRLLSARKPRRVRPSALPSGGLWELGA